MADRPDELEFWLPSEFLTDEDILMDTSYQASDYASARFRFPTSVTQRFAPFSTGSALSSPVQSVVGSTGTESDEEDSLLTELTGQLTLVDCDRFASTRPNHENWVLPGSPQSTLSYVGSWSGRSTLSSNGSSNGPSQVSSPPTTPLATNNAAWDLIFKAAALFEGHKSNGTGGPHSTNYSGIFERQRSFSSHPHSKLPVQSSVYHNYFERRLDLLGQERCVMRSPNAYKLDCNMAGRFGNVAPNVGRRAGGSGILAAGHGAWANVQIGNQNHQQVGSAVRGGLHLAGGHGYGCGSVGMKKSERVGTGVFIPRRYGDDSSANRPFNTVDSRKKSGYSSAYSGKKLPITNKNLNNRSGFAGYQSQTIAGGDAIADYDALLARRASLFTSRRTTAVAEGAINHELCLTQEWTC